MAIGSTFPSVPAGWRSRGAHAVAMALSLLVPDGGVLAADTGHTKAGRATGTPHLHPTPRSMTSRPEDVRIPSAVTLVRGASTDGSALAIVQDVLRDAGVRTIRLVDDHTPARDDRLTVHVGGHKENAATADALHALGVQGAETMAAEGYVLAVGEGRDGRDRIVLSGVDGAGTYYAAQTLRQLVRGPRLGGLVIRDWPSLRWRGVADGTYGPPPSHQQRLADFDFLGRHKLNSYLYTAKDDPYLRADWRTQYPADELRRIGELVRRAHANHVAFGCVLSPGLSVCYSKPSEAEALAAKFDSLWGLGVRSFVVAFDDIGHQRWNWEEDGAAFGTGPAAAARAQAHLINAVLGAFIDTHPGAEPLQMVPTEYRGSARTDYTRRIAEDLHPGVVVQWTGMDAIAPRLTRADVAAAREMFGHPVLLRDTCPVHDSARGRLPLGPFTGRESRLGESLLGLTAHPMPQAQASRIALSGVADYAWNDTAYDPERSWSAALDELAGGGERTAEALRAFAGVQWSARIDPRRAPELAALIEEFRHTGKAGPLHRALAAVHDAPRVLREGLENRAFLTETAPWLDATEAWGRAALGALDMLTAQRAGRGAEAWAARQSLPALVERAKSSVWTGPDHAREVPVELDPVLAQFVEDSLVENTRWLGLAQPAPITNLPLLDGCFPVSHMTDGDPATYFWGAAAAAPGHFAGIDLGRPRPVTGVEVQMGSSDSPDDFIHEGVLEYSSDGTTWTEVEAFTGETTVKVDLPAGTVARFVRLRVTQAQDNWVVVREFTVRRGDVLTVSGTPPPTGGSDFALAADEDPGTAYEAAASASAGDALLAELPTARELRKVLILQPGTKTAGGEVQIRTPKGWTTLGPLSGTGFTELPARGIEADAVRLRWAPGSRPPAVSEILPVYAGDAPVSVGFTPSTVALETGDRAVLTAVLTSTRCEDQRLSVRTHPPKGITLTPARGDVPLPRGARTELPLEIRASADAAPGTHHIPVTVHGNHGTPPARATLSVTVWPG